MLRTAPAALKYAEWLFYLEGRTRGTVRDRGEGVVKQGRGSRVRASVSVPAMSLANARAVRAWLHSLRGSAVPTLLRMPHSFEPGAAVKSYFATGTGAADGSVIAAESDIAGLSAGMWLSLEDGRQTCVVLEVSGSDITVAPALRFDFDGIFGWGDVFGRFRLEDDTPAIPFATDRSEPFDITFTEVLGEKSNSELLLDWAPGVVIDFTDQSATVIPTPEPATGAESLLGNEPGVAIDFTDQSARITEAD